MQNTLTTLIERQALRNPDREAYFTRRPGSAEWQPTTWHTFADNVGAAACALEILGLEPQQILTIFSANREEILTADFGAYANRGIPVSLYATSSLEQVEYILNDTRAAIIFTGDAKQYAIARSAMAKCPTLRQIITIDSSVIPDADDTTTMTFDAFIALGRAASDACRAEVEKRRLAAKPSDIATLIYTSGTTGEPKGATLLHSCFDAAMEIHIERLTMLSDSDTSVTFLPLSHIFEKAWTYFCLVMSMKVWINTDPREITDTLRQVRPTCMCSVPRFWEKAYTAVQEKIASMGWLQRTIVSRALKIGERRNLGYVRTGRKAPWLLERLYRLADSRVFATMRHAIGFDNPNIFPTAGAPLSDNIVRFFHSAGINIVIGYGLSETTATVTCYPNVGYVIGTVGTAMPRVQVSIGDENEILVKGPTVMAGYYNKPEATEAAFTADGWFRTGDAGHFDANGALVLTERIKDLFKTSNGKYIAPQAIESRLGEDPYIEQVAVIGDQRKYVTAIIIPAFEAIKEYARKKKIQYRNIEDLVKNADIRALIEERLNILQQGLAGFEKIKKFTLLPREFTMEAGELTNTLKIRRPVINHRYASEIEAMYV